MRSKRRPSDPAWTIVILLVRSILILCLAAGLAGCRVEAGARADDKELRVFAAASLADAFGEIGTAFTEQHPGTRVMFNFGGSQNLRTQIEQGARVDVFASANRAEIESLARSEFIDLANIRIFTENTLTVLLPEGNPAKLQSLQDLASPGVKLVVAAEEVPAGLYARQVLRGLEGVYGSDYYGAVTANIVSNEDNIRQVVAKVELGEADAGIVYASEAAGMPALPTLEIPEDVNVVAEYPIAILAEASHAELADEFIDFVLSEDGQAILARWGFRQVRP